MVAKSRGLSPTITVSGVMSANEKSTRPPLGIAWKIWSLRIQLRLLAQSPCQLRPRRCAMPRLPT